MIDKRMGKKSFWKRKREYRVKLGVAFVTLMFLCHALNPLYAYASPKSGAAGSTEELEQNAEERKKLPIQSNEKANWPAGPEIGAEAAILMDVDTGTILYSKNIHEELYPASTTKLLTCLIAQEHGNMSDMVKFSNEAVFSVPRDGSNIGMDVGQSISLEQCMYGILVGSANEVANAVAEHISGSIEEFVDLMNETATSLGCKNSHFANANGLQSDDHYTSAYDLALIACEYFSNESLSRVANTPRYHFEPTETQPDDFYIKNKHALINGEIPYEGIKGGKTGYTDDARQTLVTCCEQNGMKLVCVVFMEESPDQFYDTVTLFDYGYSNFEIVNVSENETRYTINTESFFKTGSDIFGNSQPFLTINENSKIILPLNTSFSDLDTRVSFDVDDAVAQIFYSFSGVDLGSALVETLDNAQPDYEFEHVSVTDEEPSETGFTITQEDKTVFVNVKIVILICAGAACGVILLVTIIKVTHDYHFSGRAEDKRRRRRNKRKRRKGGYVSDFSDYRF